MKYSLYTCTRISCSKQSNLIGQLEVPYFTYRPPIVKGLTNKSKIGLPRAKKDAWSNSSLVPGPGQISWLRLLYSISVRDLIQLWSLCILKDPQALSSTLALLQPQAFGSLKMCVDLGLSL